MPVDGFDEPTHELFVRYLEVGFISAVIDIRFKVDDFFPSITVDDKVVLEFLAKRSFGFHKQKVEAYRHIAFRCQSEILSDFDKLAINELIPKQLADKHSSR